MTLSLDAQGFPARDGQLLGLPPKERAVLSLLIRRAPGVVGKQDFADTVWAGGEMSDESLARCISRIRAVFADARGPRIESVYGAGYRLETGVGRSVGHPRLSSAARAPPQAVEALLHARLLAQRRTPAAMDRALQLLRALTEQHPRYVPARIALAEAIGAAAGWALQPAADLIAQGLAQLDAAERLDPAGFGIATARAHLLDCAWRYDEARVAWSLAFPGAADDPDSLFLHGRFLLVTGDAAGAIGQLREAVRLHPHSALFRVTLARAHAHAGDTAAAWAEASGACEDHPDSVIAAVYRLGLQAWLRPEAGTSKALWLVANRRDAPPLALSACAYALARVGRTEDARDVIDAALGCSASSTCGAVLYVAALLALGEVDRALALLSAAESAHCAVLPMVWRDPANAGLRGVPAFEAMGLRVFGARAAAPP